MKFFHHDHSYLPLELLDQAADARVERCQLARRVSRVEVDEHAVRDERRADELQELPVAVLDPSVYELRFQISSGRAHREHREHRALRLPCLSGD